MTITNQEYSDLINYFTVHNVTNHIISLALTTVNETIAAGARDSIATGISLEQSWDIMDGLNNSNSTFMASSSLPTSYMPQPSATYGSTASSSSTIPFMHSHGDNATLLQFASNDTTTTLMLTNRTTRLLEKRTRSSTTEIPIWLIPCYSIIFIFAIVGNLLVASTLFQNRRMRTITNVFLANLAISDMLLGVLCMPITLVGTYLRHFIFGELVCKFIQFAQAASVAVSSWTLVAISCERYYAICHPLRSRTWQTINHAYKIIGCIWIGSILCMAPIAIFSQLIPTSRQGLRKCREQWPQHAVGYERSYNIFLDLVLLVLPLGILCIAYILITRTLYLGIKDEKALIFGSKNNNVVNVSTAGVVVSNTHTTPMAPDGKIYTQVTTSMSATANTKPTNIFKLNFSLRYPTRKGGGSLLRGGSISTNKSNDSTTNNGREIRFPNNSNSDRCKYLTSKSVDSSTQITNTSTTTNTPSVKEAVSHNTGKTRPEPEVICMKINESNNELPQHQQQQLQQSKASSSSSIQQHCYDDITQLSATPTIAEQTTSSINPLNSKRAIVAKTTDGRRQQLYCMRSASFKSFNRNSRTSADSEETTSSSCHSLNALSTKFQRQLKPTHQSVATSSATQRQYHQQQPACMSASDSCGGGGTEKRKLNSSPSLRITESALRRSNIEKTLESKKRVVKMLFVLVLEFFICWTPLYVINTLAMFIGPATYEYVDYTTISFLQLLAYSSSCCNPITYCFMNASFRRAFVDTFRGIHLNGGTFWHKNSKASAATNLSMAGNSIAMGNSCTVVTANTVLDSPRL
ncbi:uncharacterized protein [Musca autumnalis]|uniref:uncharacterized protein n=1 Tax=Musca autumnalis TaxID=221902 RepID=UPI003CF01288